ncbi:MAG: PGF-pre-PGF domain-containing protein, partial [Methanococcoides sp.]|nr:PGF-pre-PGF domain-containing protein [Methanococcoides sp.]
MSAGLVSAYDADTNDDGKLNFIKFDENDILENNIIPNPGGGGGSGDNSSSGSGSGSDGISSPAFDEADDFSSWSSDSSWEINGQNYSGFYYNIHADAYGESLTIYENGTNGTRTLNTSLSQNSLVYRSVLFNVYPEFAFMQQDNPASHFTYPIIGFAGEAYTPLVKGDASNLSRLMIDDDNSYVLRVSDTLELGEDYAITPVQIDVEGENVWLKLTKNGNFIDNAIINVGTNGTTSDKTWNFEQDVGDVEDVVTLMIHVDEVNQSQVDSLCVIEGIWQISDESLVIEEGDVFGNLVVTAMTSDSIEMELFEPLTLLPGDEYNLFVTPENLIIRVADSDSLRFNFVKQVNANELYEVRGSVAEPEFESDEITWTANGDYSFTGFWYHLDSDQSSESLTLKNVTNDTRVFEEGDVNYTATIAYDLDPEFNFTTKGSPNNEMKYDVIGFTGEAYVPLAKGDASKISRLLIDDDSRYTLRTSDTLVLAEGYSICPLQIDVEGEKVWFELTKNGTFIDDAIINVGTNGTTSDKTWYYEQDILNENDVLTLMIHVDQLFQGTVDSLCVIEGVWQISDSAMEIDVEDEFGKLIVTADGSGGTIEMENNEALELSRDSEIEIFGGLKFRTADSPDIRFYPFVTFELPECSIDLIYPNPAFEGNNIIFKGHGTDHDGLIAAPIWESNAYIWESSIDGLLSNNSSFTTSSLSPGNHEISLKVQNDEGAWSPTQSMNLFVFSASQAEELLSPVFAEASDFGAWNPNSIWEVNAPDFSGFYYDDIADLYGETLTVYENRTSGSRTLDEGSLVYETTVMEGFDPVFPFLLSDGTTPFTYDMIAFFGDLYVPVNGDVSLLSEVLVDDNSTYLLGMGNSLELGEGYAITPKQIDVDGDKVWLELTKNGTFIDDAIINVGTNAITSDKTWYYEQDISGEDDVLTLMIHVDEVNQSGNFIIIDGIWQLSDEPWVIGDDDTVGRMEVAALGSDRIVMELYEPITLSANETYNLARNLGVKVVGNESLLRFSLVMRILSNLSPTATIDSISPDPESETATFIGSGTDTYGTIVGYNWTSSIDGQLSTSAYFSTSDISIGTHTIYFSVQDDEGAWSDTVSRTLEVVDNQTPEVHNGNGGGGSSSGGGGGNTGEAFENILAKDAQSSTVAIGELSRYEFAKEWCNISYVQFEGVANAGRISTLIEGLKNTSSLVDSPAPGNVYQNLNLWVGNAAFSNDKIENAVIGFRISKAWLSENSIDESSVALYRYDGKWNKLFTTKTSEDDSYIYFEAEAPGFSPFAIVG